MPIETETVFSGFPTGKKDKKGKEIYRDSPSLYHSNGTISYNYSKGGGRKSKRNARSRRNSKKSKRVRHTRRKQTRRHRHSRRR
jgi:hypothetical protein